MTPRPGRRPRATTRDELLDLFAIVGTPEEAVAEIRRRYGDLATRVTLHLPAGIDPDRRAALFAELRKPA